MYRPARIKTIHPLCARLQLEAETGPAGWQRLSGRSEPISDDAFAYGLEQARAEDLRGVLRQVKETNASGQIVDVTEYYSHFGDNFAPSKQARSSDFRGNR